MKVDYAGKTITLPVKIKDAKADRPISFKLDVMPIFMRSGCNTGDCHGAARGKDGFRLSLFGFDPDGDHYRLTHELVGRRVNLALPHESLLMQKATGQVPHTGGQLFDEKSYLYQSLLRWLEAGAPQGSTGDRQADCARGHAQAGCSRRQGGVTADDRAREVFGWHRPRRHQPGPVHQQQRDFGSGLWRRGNHCLRAW